MARYAAPPQTCRGAFSPTRLRCPRQWLGHSLRGTAHPARLRAPRPSSFYRSRAGRGTGRRAAASRPCAYKFRGGKWAWPPARVLFQSHPRHRPSHTAACSAPRTRPRARIHRAGCAWRPYWSARSGTCASRQSRHPHRTAERHPPAPRRLCSPRGTRPQPRPTHAAVQARSARSASVALPTPP